MTETKLPTAFSTIIWLATGRTSLPLLARRGIPTVRTLMLAEISGRVNKTRLTPTKRLPRVWHPGNVKSWHINFRGVKTMAGFLGSDMIGLTSFLKRSGLARAPGLSSALPTCLALPLGSLGGGGPSGTDGRTTGGHGSILPLALGSLGFLAQRRTTRGETGRLTTTAIGGLRGIATQVLALPLTALRREPIAGNTLTRPGTVVMTSRRLLA